MKPVRLAILDLYNGTPNQGMRCIQEIVSSFDKYLEWEVFDVRGAAEVPDMSFDIYLSSGGPGSPHEGDGVWDVKYFNWLSEAWAWNQDSGGSKKHVFFICHSFQMAIRHFKLAKVQRRHKTSFGTFRCHHTEIGITDPLLAGLPEPFYVADFRDWQVVQPDLERIDEMGARILALEKIRPHVPLERAIMAMRFSDTFVGTQFHPEADPFGMSAHFKDPERRAKIIADHSVQKYARMMDHLSDPDKISLTHEQVIPGFIERSIRAVRKSPVAVS